MVHRVFAVSSVLLLLTAAWGAWVDYDREWKPYQHRYSTLMLEKITDEAIRRAVRPEPIEIKQIQIRALNRVDRCTSCHLAYDNPAFANEGQPLKSHPPEILAIHPVQQYGCTICHGGQGLATTFDGAAHEPLDFWEEPMLRGVYIQASCGRCHTEGSVPGAPTLSVARVLYRDEFVCETCHVLNGEGGTDGPDLTYIGSKPLHTFDFTYVEGNRTKIRWLEEHFLDPAKVVPGSEMINQEMTAEQARAMTVLMLSLTKNTIPPEFKTGVASGPSSSPGRASLVTIQDRNLIEDKGCTLCHTLAGRGGKVGPDLSQVAGRRNADWLFQHFKNPRQVVPGSTMPDLFLTDEEANDLTRAMLSLKSQ